MSAQPYYPLYPEVEQEIRRNIDVDNRISQTRGALALYSQCGVNFAKAMDACIELETNWGDSLVAQNEDKLTAINTQMQKSMDIVTKMEKLTAVRSALARTIHDEVLPGAVEVGTLAEKASEAEYPHYTFLRNASDIELGNGMSRYSRATLQPFEALWKEVMDIIDPGEELDVASYIGEDPVFARTQRSEIDPCTGEPWKHVVRCVKCNHRFSRHHILAHIQNDRLCPVSSCDVQIYQRDLVDDPEFEKRVEIWKKRSIRDTQRRTQAADTLA